MIELIKKNWIRAVPYMVLLVAVCFLISRKVDYFVDELLAYEFANNEPLCLNDGVLNVPADKPFVDVLVSDGLDIGNVWEQEINNTHPPFFYLILHLICTVFSGRFSKWFAGSINIFFILATLFVFRRIIRLFVKDDKVIFITSIMFALSAGILSISTFLRMYVMAMFFVTAIAYFVIKNINNYDIKDLFTIAIVTILGAMTHYYFIVFVFFISIAVVLGMVIQKKFKNALYYSIVMAISGGCAVLIFPAMLAHIFKKGRGSESLNNLVSSNLIGQFKEYLGILSSSIFAGGLGILMAVILFLAIIEYYSLKDGSNRINGKVKVGLFRLTCLAFSSVAYILLVSKSAPYNLERYVSPIFAVAMISVMLIIYYLIFDLVTPRCNAVFIYTVIVALITQQGLKNCEWTYLYKDDNARIAYAEENASNLDAVVIYENWWDTLHHYLEISKCRSSTFYSVTSFEEFSNKIALNPSVGNNSDIVLFISIDEPLSNECLEYLMDEFGYELTYHVNASNSEYGGGFYLQAL